MFSPGGKAHLAPGINHNRLPRRRGTARRLPCARTVQHVPEERQGPAQLPYCTVLPTWSAGAHIKIRRISWTNYRHLSDAVVDVRRHLVLVGPNASGKSSVLRAVALCLGSGQELASIGVRDFSDAAQPLVIEVVVDALNDDDRAAFPDEVDVMGDQTVAVRVTATVDPSDPDATLVVERGFPLGGHGRRPTTPQLQRFGFSFVPAARSLGRELAGAQGAARRLLSALDMTADGSALVDAQQALRDALAASATIGDFRVGLASRLTDALPGEVTKDDVQLILTSDVLDAPLAGTTLTLNDRGHAAPLQEQSDGVQALSVLALLAMLTANSRIVAIDEPETYLHPTAQRAVVSALLDGATQRLLATHSSSVVSVAEPHDIVALGTDGRVRQLPAGSSIGAPLRLLRDWRQGLVEPLTARSVLMLEGASDRIVLEAVAHALGHSLDRWDVAIFQLDGSRSFPTAWDFFGAPGLGLPVRGMCDEDAKEDWANAIAVPVADLPDHGILVLQPDLEGHYVNTLGTTRVLELIRTARLVTDGQLTGRSGKHDPSQLTPHELSSVCRKYKTAVAASLAVGLTAADVTALGAVAVFVESLAP